MYAIRSYYGIPELSNSMITFLTARGEDYSQIAGFEAGADDYIAKPIKPKVFISRVKALLKRYVPEGESSSEGLEDEGNKITLGDLIIDRERYVVINKGESYNFV